MNLLAWRDTLKGIVLIFFAVMFFTINAQATGLYYDFTHSFVLIQELGPSGKENDLKPIGSGLVVEIANCYTESYLITKPELFQGRDSVFIKATGVSLEDEPSIYSVELLKNGNKLWTSFADSNYEIAGVLMLPFSGMICAVDTSYFRPLHDVYPGDVAIYLEHIHVGDTVWDWRQVVARNSIVSLVPEYGDYFYNEAEKWSERWPFVDKLFYIDADPSLWSECSPVFSTSADSSHWGYCIGILMGKNKNIHLATVVPTDAIIKLIDYFHGCEKLDSLLIPAKH
jgi:hypothetical protein